MRPVAPGFVAALVALADGLFAGVGNVDDHGADAGIQPGVGSVTIGQLFRVAALAVGLLAGGFVADDGFGSVFDIHKCSILLAEVAFNPYMIACGSRNRQYNDWDAD